MRNLTMTILLGATLFACSPPEVTAPTVPVNDDFNDEKATLIGSGMIMGIGHTADGTASLYEYEGEYFVVLDPYSSQNGPDLKVYLSKDGDATEYIRLGNLKSTMGKQSYRVPGMPDIATYKYVHVWCERYTVVFAKAELD
jgi:hypothetical protein